MMKLTIVLLMVFLIVPFSYAEYKLVHDAKLVRIGIDVNKCVFKKNEIKGDKNKVEVFVKIPITVSALNSNKTAASQFSEVLIQKMIMPQNQVKAFGGVKKIAMTMVASVKDEAKKLEEFSSLGLFVTVLLSDTGFTVRKETYEEAGSKFKYVFRGIDSYLIKNTGMDTGEAVIYSIKKTGKFVVTGSDLSKLAVY